MSLVTTICCYPYWITYLLTYLLVA